MEPRQGREPLQLHPAVGREVVVGEDRVGGDAQHRARAEEDGEVAREGLGLLLVGGDGQHRAGPARPRREELAQEEAAGGPDEAGHLGVAGLEGAANALMRAGTCACAGARTGALDLPGCGHGPRSGRHLRGVPGRCHGEAPQGDDPEGG